MEARTSGTNDSHEIVGTPEEKRTPAAEAAVPMRDMRHPSTSLRTGSEAVPLSRTDFCGVLNIRFSAGYLMGQ
jgi:hypothetical protein